MISLYCLVGGFVVTAVYIYFLAIGYKIILSSPLRFIAALLILAGIQTANRAERKAEFVRRQVVKKKLSSDRSADYFERLVGINVGWNFWGTYGIHLCGVFYL